MRARHDQGGKDGMMLDEIQKSDRIGRVSQLSKVLRGAV